MNETIDKLRTAAIRIGLSNERLILYAIEKRNHPIAAIQLWVNAGSAKERTNARGCAHLTEHMIARNIHFSELKTNENLLSGMWNAQTSRDYTMYSTVVLSEHIFKEIKNFIFGVLCPRFDEETINTEKSVVINELLLQRSDPFYDAETNLWRLAFKNHKYGSPISGTVEDVSNLTLSNIQSFFETNYNPDNLLLVIVGDFSANELINYISNLTADIPDRSGINCQVNNEPISEYQNNNLALRHNRSVIESENVENALIQIGNPSVPLIADNYFPSKVIESIIYEKLRLSRKRTESIQIISELYRLQAACFLKVSAFTSTDRIDEIENYIRHFLENLESKISNVSINRAKIYTEMEFATKSIRCQDIASDVGLLSILNLPPSLLLYKGQIKSVNREQIIETLRLLYSQPNEVISIIRPKVR